VTLGVSQPSPLTEILTRGLEGEKILTGIVNSHTFPHYSNMKSGWRERRKSSLSQVSVVAPLDLEELDYFMPCHMIPPIQDFDWALGE
jgi:hypothetical protein